MRQKYKDQLDALQKHLGDIDDMLYDRFPFGQKVAGIRTRINTLTGEMDDTLRNTEAYMSAMTKLCARIANKVFKCTDCFDEGGPKGEYCKVCGKKGKA